MINLNLPPNSIQKGFLYEDYELFELDQDILEIDLPSGLTIDVGWYPQHDPNGAFQIVVFKDYWDAQKQKPILARNPIQVASLVEALASAYSVPLVTSVATPAATNQSHTEYIERGSQPFTAKVGNNYLISA
jgi:hypothetical protein